MAGGWYYQLDENRISIKMTMIGFSLFLHSVRFGPKVIRLVVKFWSSFPPLLPPYQMIWSGAGNGWSALHSTLSDTGSGWVQDIESSARIDNNDKTEGSHQELTSIKLLGTGEGNTRSFFCQIVINILVIKKLLNHYNQRFWRLTLLCSRLHCKWEATWWRRKKLSKLLLIFNLSPASLDTIVFLHPTGWMLILSK